MGPQLRKGSTDDKGPFSFWMPSVFIHQKVSNMISFGPKKLYGANFRMGAQDYLVTPIAELQGEASHTIHHHVTRHDLTHLRILVISVIFRPKRVIITKGGHHM